MLRDVLLSLCQLKCIGDAVNFCNVQDCDVPNRQIKRCCDTLNDAFW